MGIAPAIDLTADQRRTVLALLNRHLPNTTVWAYGSRVKWTSHPASDLDLVAFAKPEQSPRIAELREAFDESNLPFRVDLFVWDEMPESFKDRIKAEHADLTPKGTKVRITANESKHENDWTTIQLGTACKKIGSGMTPRGGSAVYRDKGPCALIRSQNIHNDGFHHDGLVFIDEQRATDLNNVEVRLHDVLLNITGDSVARCCQVGPDVLPARVNQHVAIVRPDPEVLQPQFLRYALIEPRMQGRLLSWAGAGGTRSALTKEMIESFEVFAPTKVQEQRAIAQILSTLDDKIELNRRMNETLEAMARALFKSWFVDFDPILGANAGKKCKVPPKVSRLFPRHLVESDIGKIPDSWSVKSLGDLLEFVYGKALRSDERRRGSIPVFGSNGRVGWHDRKLVNGPGIVVGRKGNPGVVTWSQSDFFPIDTTFYVVPKGKVSLRFLFYALRNQKLQSIAADSAVPGLNRNIAYMNRQLVPGAEVMDAFDRHADGVLFRRDQLNAESRALAGLRDTLLPKLISGEIRIQDAEELAEAAT